MKSYHGRMDGRPIEAAQWIDTDDARHAFADWFGRHDMMFETRGPVVALRDIMVNEGEWVAIDHDEQIMVLPDREFRQNYLVCTMPCDVTDCPDQCALPGPHDGLCACPRKIAALVTAGVTGAWQVE